MRKPFFKLIKYDLVIGTRQNLFKILIGGCLLMFLCGVTVLDNNGAASYPAYIACVFWGVPEYIPMESDEFSLPVIWLLLHLYALFLVVTYPTYDICGTGKNILLLSANRKRWWFCKCLWTAINVTIYVLLLYLVMRIATMGKTETLVSQEVISEAIGLNMTQDGTVYIFFLPIAVLTALALLQQWLSFITRHPAVAYMVSAGILVASVYWKTPLLVGNFTMLARLEPFARDGVVPWLGFITAGIIAGTACIAGAVHIKKYDVLDKEDIKI